MSNRAPILFLILAVVAYILYNSIFVLNERQQAIVLRFGEIQRVETEPGLYLKVPLSFAGFDELQIIEDRLLRFDLDDMRVQVSDGKFYEVDAFLTYRISDARVFRSQVSGSIQLAETRLRTRFDDALRGVYSLRGFEAALSAERAEMMLEVRNKLRPDATSLGLTIDDVRIRRTDLTAEVSDQTFARMNAERLAVAERLRARGQEAARRIRARADREVIEIKAEATRDGEVLRGEGEGERTKILADAFGRDPEFFDFYRSMSAYDHALQSDGPDMVISPDSEFFKYFKDSTGKPASAPAASGQ